MDVDKIINRSGNCSAPPTKNEQSELVKSLKAQGYEESSSKSKLVYDFKKKAESRDSSPYKPDPMQFIRPQQNQIDNITKKQAGTNATTVCTIFHYNSRIISNQSMNMIHNVWDLLFKERFSRKGRQYLKYLISLQLNPKHFMVEASKHWVCR